MKKIILMVALCTITALASPAEWKFTPPPNLQTQLEINQWAGEEFSKADAELNKVWKALLPKLQSKEKEALISAQLLWIKYRDANAEAAALAYEGGSIAPFMRAESKAITTRMRTWQLKTRLDELIRLGN